MPPTAPADAPALFVADGERLLPTPLSGGPWRAGTQHGSPMLGLLARALERFPTDRPAQVTRLSADLLRAAPLAPIELSVRQVRRGGLVEVLEAELRSGGELYARASAARFRVEAIDTGDYGEAPRPPDSLPEGAPGVSREFAQPSFANVLDIRPLPGPGGPIVWVGVRLPLVLGEQTSALERVAMAADFTYSSPIIVRRIEDASFVPEADFVTINPDTTIHLHRPLEGAWVGLQARVRYGGLGAGTAAATVWDARGPLGVTAQSVLVRRSATRTMGWEAAKS